MGAAIPLLLLQLPTETPPPGEGDGTGEGEFAALLELAALPPELERPDPDAEGDAPAAQRPEDASDGALAEATLPSELAEDPSLPLGGIAPSANRAGTTDADRTATPGAAPEPRSAESFAAQARTPQTTPERPAASVADAPAASVAAAPAARAPAEAAVEARPDALAAAGVPRPAEESAPRARFEATRQADLRTSFRASSREAPTPPADAEASRSIREFANAQLEAEPRPLQASAPAPAPVIAPENPAAPLWIGPTSNAAPQALTASGEVARGLGSPPVPPEGLPLQIEWLAERGGGRARVQLHPPHLGHVELEVRTRGSEVEVILNVGEAAAHAPLQAQRQPLSQALAALDLELANFEVADRNAGQQRSQQQDPNAANPDHPRGQARPANPPDGQALPPNPTTTVRSRDAGIDVRI